MLGRLDDNVTDVPGYCNLLRRNLSFGSSRLIDNIARTENLRDDNSFDAEVSLTEADFHSLDADQLIRDRQQNGELPRVTLLHLRDDRPWGAFAAARNSQLASGHPAPSP